MNEVTTLTPGPAPGGTPGVEQQTPAVNRAVRVQLDKVVAEERQTTTEGMAKVRLVIAAIAVPLVLPLTSVPGVSTMVPTSVGTCVYFVLALLLFLCTRRWRGAGWLAFSVALVDVPTLGLTELVQQQYVAQPVLSAIPTVALMGGLSALSALSLSRPAVVAATVPALGIQLAVMHFGHLEVGPQLPVMLATAGVGGIAWVTVGRLRKLVEKAREKDLLSKYLLGKRIGVGGMAEVFEATYAPQGGFERRVAVKRILPAYAHDLESVALFRREAELGALLAHPNVVQVLDFGTDGATWFLAMEYVDGVPLSRLLKEPSPEQPLLPLHAAVAVAWQLCEALHYIHERVSASGVPLKLVHRDFNPPNVMVSRVGEVKVADFGIARVADREGFTRTGAVRGKVAYLAPEQLRGQPYDARADLYALGVTLHEVLTGQRVFTASNDALLILACLGQPIDPPSARRPEVPPQLDAIIMGLLERDAQRRTPTAHAARLQLEALPPPLTDLLAGKAVLAKAVQRLPATGSVELTSSPRQHVGPDGATSTSTIGTV